MHYDTCIYQGLLQVNQCAATDTMKQNNMSLFEFHATSDQN